MRQYKKKYEEVSKILDFSKSESIKKDDVIEGLNDDLKNKEHELEIQRTKHLEEKINLLYKLVDALQNKTNTNYCQFRTKKTKTSPYCLLCILFSFFWRLPEELHRRASGGFLSSYSGTVWSHFYANLRAKTYQNVSQTDVRNRRSEQPHKKEIPFC